MFRRLLIIVLIAGGSMTAFAQTGSDPPSYALVTPRPINPAAGSTNPSAAATQSLNPYLGSVPGGKLVEGEIKLTLADDVRRGLDFNLGLIESQQADAGVKAARARAFAALLPQITARAQQSFEQISTAEIGIKLPPQTGIRLPATLGGFGYSETRVDIQYPVFDSSLRAEYQSRKAAEAASALSAKDARDVVVYAVGTAYFQPVRPGWTQQGPPSPPPRNSPLRSLMSTTLNWRRRSIASALRSNFALPTNASRVPKTTLKKTS